MTKFINEDLLAEHVGAVYKPPLHPVHNPISFNRPPSPAAALTLKGNGPRRHHHNRRRLNKETGHEG